MKTVLIIFLILFCTPKIFAESNSIEPVEKSKHESRIKNEIYKTLKDFKAADIENVENSKIDDFYNALFDANKLMILDKGDDELVYEMLRVSLLTFKYDPTKYSIDIIYPSFEKQKEQYKKVIEKFSKKDAAELAKSLKIADDFANELRKDN